jgi:hypothetical protein
MSLSGPSMKLMRLGSGPTPAIPLTESLGRLFL